MIDLISHTHRDLTDDDIARIASDYAWRDGAGAYEGLPGFGKSPSLAVVRRHRDVLTPERYVGTESQPDDGEPFEAKMERLARTIRCAVTRRYSSPHGILRTRWVAKV